MNDNHINTQCSGLISGVRFLLPGRVKLPDFFAVREDVN